MSLIIGVSVLNSSCYEPPPRPKQPARGVAAYIQMEVSTITGEDLLVTGSTPTGGYFYLRVDPTSGTVLKWKIAPDDLVPPR